MLEKIEEDILEETLETLETKETQKNDQKNEILKNDLKEKFELISDFDYELGFDLSEIDIKLILFYILLILICIAIILFLNNLYLKRITRNSFGTNSFQQIPSFETFPAFSFQQIPLKNSW